MNTLDLGAMSPLSLHGPVCWAQRPYFIKRAHLQVLHWERDTALVGRGEVMIRELGDDGEGRGEFGLTGSVEKEARMSANRKTLSRGAQVQESWRQDSGSKERSSWKNKHRDEGKSGPDPVIGRGQSRDCPQASHAGGGA